LAAELSQQRLKVFDHHVMRGAICRHDSVTIVHAHTVVSERLPKQISQTPAGFD
jgi:hypothetical protein